MKKDPLRDNRIFPEEMQEQPVQNHDATTPVARFLRVLIVLVLLGVLAFFVYQYMQPSPLPVDPSPSVEEQRYIEEKVFYEQVTKTPSIDTYQRAFLINSN